MAKRKYFECKVCKKTIRRNVVKHIQEDHNLSPEEYFDKYLREDENQGKCKLCGNPTKLVLKKGWFYRDYCGSSCAKKASWAREDSGERKGRQNPDFIRKMREKALKMWEDPEYRQKMSDMKKDWWKDPENAQFMSEMSTELWEDEEYRRIHSEKYSEFMKKKWQDPEYRERKCKEVSEQWRTLWKRPDYKARVAEIISESTRKAWEDPEKRRNIISGIKDSWTPERRDELSKVMTERLLDPNDPWGSEYRGTRTEYNGITYRSKFEASFAYFLDKEGIEFEYEKHTIKLREGKRYTPDFYLTESNSFIELTPEYYIEDHLDKVNDARSLGHKIQIVTENGFENC